MKRLAWLVLVVPLSGCVTFEACKGDVCVNGTSFMRPLASVTATVPRSNDEGDIEVEIIYSPDQVSLGAAAELIRAATPGGG